MYHRDEVTAVRFTPDGRALVTVSGEPLGGRRAQLWEAETGEPLTPPLALGRADTAEAFVPDSGRLRFSVKRTLADRPTVLAWDVAPDVPAEALALLVDVVSCRGVTEAGVVVPLETAEFARAWKTLREKYPRLVDAPPVR
jgi:hypothetical protein